MLAEYEQPDPDASRSQWFAEHALAHSIDSPSYCPWCGAAVDAGEGALVVEYWTGEQRVFTCWCRSCGWSGEIVRVDRVVGHEAG